MNLTIMVTTCFLKIKAKLCGMFILNYGVFRVHWVDTTLPHLIGEFLWIQISAKLLFCSRYDLIIMSVEFIL